MDTLLRSYKGVPGVSDNDTVLGVTIPLKLRAGGLSQPTRPYQGSGKERLISLPFCQRQWSPRPCPATVMGMESTHVAHACQLVGAEWAADGTAGGRGARLLAEECTSVLAGPAACLSSPSVTSLRHRSAAGSHFTHSSPEGPKCLTSYELTASPSTGVV